MPLILHHQSCPSNCTMLIQNRFLFLLCPWFIAHILHISGSFSFSLRSTICCILGTKRRSTRRWKYAFSLWFLILQLPSWLFLSFSPFLSFFKFLASLIKFMNFLYFLKFMYFLYFPQLLSFAQLFIIAYLMVFILLFNFAQPVVLIDSLISFLLIYFHLWLQLLLQFTLLLQRIILFLWFLLSWC